jgi:hypothetical protein
MSARKAECAVAGCDQSAGYEIVWTNDLVYVVCHHHSDTVLERCGAELYVAVAASSLRPDTCRLVRRTEPGSRPTSTCAREEPPCADGSPAAPQSGVGLQPSKR